MSACPCGGKEGIYDCPRCHGEGLVKVRVSGQKTFGIHFEPFKKIVACTNNCEQGKLPCFCKNEGDSDATR